LSALNGADALNTAKAKNHAIQMTQVFCFDYKFDDRFAIVIMVDVDAADVGVVIGNHSGEFLEHAGAIVAINRDLNWVTLSSPRVIADTGPLDGNPPIALVKKVLHVGTAAGVDSHSLSTGDVSDDLFSADWITTARAVDEEIVHHAEDVVVHPLPHRSGDDGGDGPGHEHGGAHAAPATEIGMDHQGDRKSEDRLDGEGGDGEVREFGA